MNSTLLNILQGLPQPAPAFLCHLLVPPLPKASFCARFTNSLPLLGPPHFRLSGRLLPIQFTELTSADSSRISGSVISPEQWSLTTLAKAVTTSSSVLSQAFPVLVLYNTAFLQSTNICQAPTMCQTLF